MKKSVLFRRQYESAHTNFMSGKVAHFLNDAFREVGAANVTPVLLEAAMTTLTQMSETFPFRVSGGVYDSIEVEGGLLKPSSSVGGSVISLQPDAIGRKDDFRFNMTIFGISAQYGHIRSKPLPISIRIDHVDERYSQRASGLSEQEMNRAMPFALMISKALEKRMLMRGDGKAPFVFPTESGLLMGIAEIVPQKTYYTEVDYYIENAQNSFKGSFMWNPVVDMKIFTFFGPGEMNPTRQRLHEILHKYVSRHSDVCDALAPEISDYIFAPIPGFTYPHHSDPHYTGAKSAAESIVNSKLWNSAVILPATMRSGGKPGDNWRP